MIDISNPVQPQSAGHCNVPGIATSVYVSDSLAYVANRDAGLRVIDISDPTQPEEVGYYDTPNHVLDVYVSGSLAYVADKSGGLRVIDSSEPTTLREMGCYVTPFWACGVYVHNSLVYVNGYDGGFTILEFCGETAVESKKKDSQTLPQGFAVSQNYPNPFNLATSITYQLPVPTNVSIKIFNINGRLVRTLLQRRTEAGYHTVQWDGRDDTGRNVTSGIYVYQVTAGGYRLTKKMLLVR